MKVSGLLVFACVAVLSAGCNSRGRTDTTVGNSATNGGATADATGTAGAISSSDKDFVNDQLSGGMAEIQIAQLANDHASSPEVKRFAQMMINDHSKADDRLKEIASTNAIPEDPQIDKKHQELMDKLSKLQGSDFDKAYMDAMVDDHKEDVSAIRSRVDENRTITQKLEGKNPEDTAAVKPKVSDDRVTMAVNQWAADTLPAIEHHLDSAEQAKSDLSKSTAQATTGSGHPSPAK